ncbi:MAG: valine--tRNA ligase [Planctomycetes bacterium]|nr:valine--tRNA ligase [Planctomycetota bacterium]MCB9901883.1 valine--tRNA ligase [Planctomycetota bacterium]
MLDEPYEPTTIDAFAQELWEREGVYRFDPQAPGEVLSVDTPPPTVSGSLHVGHVFSYTQAECIVRFQRMRGRNVFYPFGFDDNGLPTERLAEKEHGVLGRELPREEFVRLCRETAARYEAEFETLWRSLGISADWSLRYGTIDERCIRISQRGFLDLLDKDQAYLKTSPTLWDTETQTAVAQAELDDKTQQTTMNRLRFDLVDGGAVEIATTRPELLCACVAMFVHPSHARAQELIGQKARVPLFGHEVLIRADDKVDPEKGTGVVMCCTFGDKTDVEWFQKHGLELRQAIARDGRMTALAGPEEGLFAKQARRAILARLEEAGHLVAQEALENVVKVFERTGREIEFLPTRQWFVKVLDKKDKLVELGARIRWFPEHMGKRYRNWVEGLEWDWCISRQRFFGVPFPVWFCAGCGHVFRAPEAWLPVLDHDNHRIDEACPSCGGTTWEPERDVMDTWATSSETPSINHRWGEREDERRSPLPMSLRPQAHDIIRTWAFYTIVKSWAHFADVPWGDVMVSGHVQTAKGEKIAKNKANTPTDPRDMIDAHGADAVRYWALSATLGSDYRYSEDDLKQGRRLGVKLWNASRLARQHLADFDPRAERPSDTPIDAWVRGRLAETVRIATDHLERYEFGLAKGDVERFFWGELCDNYLEMIKTRLHGGESAEAIAARRAAQAGLYDVLSAVVRMLSPYVPHVCEVVWQELFRAHEGVASVAIAPWPAATPPADAEAAEADGEAAVAALTAVRRWRTEQKVGAGKPLVAARLALGTEVAARFDRVREAVVAAARLEAFEVHTDADLPPAEARLEAAEVATPPAS